MTNKNEFHLNYEIQQIASYNIDMQNCIRSLIRCVYNLTSISYILCNIHLIFILQFSTLIVIIIISN